MNKKIIYDYVICGSGAAGLSLINELINDNFFLNHRILLLDKKKKITNDRTWTYWEKGEGKHDDILKKKWGKACFSSKNLKLTFETKPYQFKSIRGINFYDKILKKISKYKNIKVLNEEVKKIIDQNDIVKVITNKNTFKCKKAFSSIMKPISDNKKHPLLKQHFIGWFIKTEKNIFNDDKITFMDFDIDQKNNTRFMYILPFKKNEALIEYTLFSKNILNDNEYETEIKNYIDEKLKVNFKIIEKENGVIPMTSFEFWKFNSKNLIYIGTAGGWTKSSTGFTFFKTIKKSKELKEYIKTNKDLDKFEKKNKYWLYDSVLIDILYENNSLGEKVFETMFKKNSPKLILDFLDEKTTFQEDIKLFLNFPKIIFLKSLVKRLFKTIFL